MMKGKLTGIQQICIVISKVLAGNKVFSVPVEGQEGHHVVFAVVPYWSVGLWVVWRRWSMPPEPLLINAVVENVNMFCCCKLASILKNSQKNLCAKLCVSDLSTNAWWRRKTGSFAEPCTDDMDPFMNTWMAACMPIRELLPNPVCGSPNPAGNQVQSKAALIDLEK